MKKPVIRIKRIYEPASADDGTRVLVDRLWPRGVSKKAAALDRWMKDLAPSTELRRWYDHDPARWAEFRQRYLDELAHKPEGVAALRRQADEAGVLTLLFACRERERNGARVLQEHLRGDGVSGH